MKKTGQFVHSKVNAILLAGFVAGTLDILSAIFFLAKGNAEAVLRFIAKAAFGQAAMEDGYAMPAMGLLFHYIIAFSFTIGYFLLYPYIPFLKKQKVISGLLYGAFAWAFMRYIVLPFTLNPPGVLTFESAWKNIVILMFAIGLPIALIAHKHYTLRT